MLFNQATSPFNVNMSEQEDISWLRRNDAYQRPTATPSMSEHVNSCMLTGTQVSGCSYQLSGNIYLILTFFVSSYYFSTTCYIWFISGGQSYVEADPHTASEKKRQRARNQYSMMTEEQRDNVLRRNRENKKVRFTDATLSHASPSSPAMQTWPSNNDPIGILDTYITNNWVAPILAA